MDDQRSPLRDANFLRYFLGNLLLQAGTWVQNVGAILWIFRETQSSVLVGLVTGVGFSMQLLIAPFAGVWADRFDRKKLIFLGQLIGGSGSVALLMLALTESLSVVPVLALVGITGLGQAVSGPATQALVPNLVVKEQITSAVALHSATFNSARAVGPLLGAASYAIGGITLCFAVNAASYVIFVLLFLWVQVRRAATAKSRGSLIEGLRVIFRDGRQRLQILAVAAVGFAIEPVTTLSPLLSQQASNNDGNVGLLIGGFGMGAAAAAFVIGALRSRFGYRTSVLLGGVFLTIGFLVTPWMGALWAQVALLLLAGFGFMLLNSNITAAIQQRVADDYRGRVMAVWSVAFLGSRPFAAVIAGYIGDHFSVVAGFVFGALMAVIATMLAVAALKTP